MSKRKIIIGLGGPLLLLSLLLLPKLSLFRNSRILTLNNSDSVTYFIKAPISVKELAEDLKKQGVIDKVDAFVDVAEYKGLSQKTIALGKYIIAPETQYRTLLNGFTLNSAGNGNAEVEVDVTFNNCRDVYQMAGKISTKLAVDSLKLVDYLTNSETLKKYGFTQEQFPAMFLPNTYKMYFDTDEKQFVARMADEFKAFWNEERKQKLNKIGLKSESEVVTLASIVYSEQSRNKEEWPVIAGLYLNRIQPGIKLQSDPTFKFCWGDKLAGVQRMLNVHRDIVCAYNTYQINGLPPGPICIPPAEVVDAVLNREANKYIFMMAKPDYSGLHDFAIEYSKHLKYAKIYQNWLANELKNQ
jgi:UPF0755 protein